MQNAFLLACAVCSLQNAKRIKGINNLIDLVLFLRTARTAYKGASLRDYYTDNLT